MIAKTFMFYNLAKKKRFYLKLGINSKIKKIKFIQIFGIDICMSIEITILYKVQKTLLIGLQSLHKQIIV
jgi:hypothetical protein